MGILILIGIIAIVSIALIFLFLEREQAVKIATALVGLYITLIGVNYGLSVYEKQTSQFDKDSAQFNLQFDNAGRDFDRRFDGAQISETDKAKQTSDKDAYTARLKTELDVASANLEVQSKAHNEALQETRQEISDLKLKAKNAVNKSGQEIGMEK